jgi:repressor LexA
MKVIHPTQQKLLDILKKNITDPLTVREMQEELGASSPSIVFHHIQQLEKNGYLRRNPSNPQDYQILADGPEKKIAYLNLYGLAHCGPRGSILDGNPVERIPIATKILGFSSTDAFLVKAKGNSMNPKIHDGDLVIVKKTNIAKSGDLIVCVNNGEALIKKIEISNNDTILVSLNQKYKPFTTDKNFRVEGVVKGVLTYAI